ncbi:Transcription-associated protein 1 [Venturia nashicola]|nr:Transcription-associated protein 1 [Venturia nashicola]
MGFSVGDFAAAAGVLYQLIKEFDSIDGAKVGYKSQLAYLKGLQMVCDYIARNHDNLSDGLIPHANTVWDNYLKLQKHLSKYPTLAPRNTNNPQDPSGAKKASETLRHAFSEIMGNVEKMQDSAMNAVAIVETYVVLELRIGIRSLEDFNDGQESGVTAASKDVQQIRILTAHLRRASGQNRDTLNKIKDSNDQQDVNAKELHDKIEDMDKRIEESQKELSESLGQLNKRIKEQRDLASDETDVQQWMNLQVEVEEEDELGNLKSSQEQVQKSLRDSQQVLEGLLLIRKLSNWKIR